MQVRIGPHLLRALGVVLIALLVALPQDKRAGVRAEPAPTPSYSHADLISNSQFVYGPAGRAFDTTGYLARRNSALLTSASEIEAWCGYASVNPQVVLTLLEMDGARVTQAARTGSSPPAGSVPVGDMVTRLAERFYAHLYQYGERAAFGPAGPGPTVALTDGATFAVGLSVSSATYAIVDMLAETLSPAEFEQAIDPANAEGFAATWARLFPGSDPLEASISITPEGAPPADLFQFPFPIGQTWWFNGAHNWNGSGEVYGKPYSSMDFFTAAESCSAPPASDWAVAAAAGSGYYPNTSASCWYRIDHTGGWTTSYYHLRNVVGKGTVAPNGRLGTIACETCVGGYATGPHVHFSLLYNGAYVDLAGVKLSGWTVYTGNGDYDSGSLERDGVFLPPYAAVLNDGTRPATPSATPTPTRTASPTGTVAPTATRAATPTATRTPSSNLAAEFIYPPAKGLIRVCPVNLVAEVNLPGGASEVRFRVSYGAGVYEIGRAVNGPDGWQLAWDCQDAPDGGATLSLSARDANGQELITDGAPTAVTLSKNCAEGTYRTAFFANPGFAGAPASSWCKASSIKYNWGAASPGAGVPGGDNFSARFRGVFRFEAGRYRFEGETDDGLRIWIDRDLALEDWHDHTNREAFQFLETLGAGLHEVRVDYYEKTGSAAVTLEWERLGPEGVLFLPLLLR